MQIILLFNLLLNLSLDVETHQEWVALARGGRRIGINEAQRLVQVANGLAGAIDFLIDRILEVSGKTLDLLRFLLKITSETGQLTDDLDFHLDGLVGLGVSLPVEVAKHLGRIGKPPGLQKGCGGRLVVDHIRGRQEEFRPSLI